MSATITDLILSLQKRNPHWSANEIAVAAKTSRNYVTTVLRLHNRRPKLEQFSNPIDAFNDRYIPEPMSGCWLWTGSISTTGYGRMTISRRQVQAHRFSYQQRHGHIQDGMEVMHKCDNPLCVNPDHLKLGTHKENMRDMYIKGRAVKKLTPKDVGKILLDRRGSRKVASEYNVTKRIIQLIRNGKLHNREEWLNGL